MTRSQAAGLLLGGLLLAAAPSAQTPSALANPTLVQRFQQTITADELAGHLYLYASDGFAGRETSSPAEKLAHLYLASQYRQMGIAPLGTQTTTDPYGLQPYVQPFDLNREVTTRVHLRAARGGAQLAETTFGPGISDGSSYLAFGNATEAPVAGGAVFAGYGVQADGYDDLAALAAAGLSTGGKWVVLLAGEPMTADGRSLITADGELTPFSQNVFNKLRPLISTDTPPVGILIVGDADPRATQTVAQRAEASVRNIGGLSLPSSTGRRRGFNIPPVVVVSMDAASAMLGRDLRAVQQQIDAARAPVVFEAEGVEITGSVAKETQTVQAGNVLAFIEGSDPALRGETVVVSAHLDHIGVDYTLVGDQINNGADDDGSGTVALLEIAEAFKAAADAGHGPRRSVLFLHVSGEEKGLLGSAYYADVDPRRPLETTVTNLNIDMIGRHDPTHPGADSNYVYIIGGDLISQPLHDWNAEVNTLTGTGLDLSARFNSPDDPNQFFRRSDHWNFGKHEIPFIFYFTGTHEDYHEVGDEPNKIDYDRMARIAQLIFGTAWQAANADERPAVTGQGFN
jgi:hypothetical protein